MMKIIKITSAIALTTFTLGAVPVRSQTPAQSSACVIRATIGENNAVTFVPDASRAQNLARQAAEKANGGLGNYRAEASMYGPLSEAPCVDNGNGSWTFNFQGGQPGFTTPTIESVVTVDGKTWDVSIDYNGSIRSTTGTSQKPASQDDNNLTLVPSNAPGLNRAQNLARQAAEKANGGLDNYRAEASMYGSTATSPVVDNGNTWTFTFKGGAPGSTEPTIESVVTVAKDGSQVTVDYNGQIRSQR